MFLPLPTPELAYWSFSDTFHDLAGHSEVRSVSLLPLVITINNIGGASPTKADLSSLFVNRCFGTPSECTKNLQIDLTKV